MKTPFLRLVHVSDAGDVDLTERWGPLLRGLTVTDERGLESDKVAVILDDRDGRIAYPPTGARVRVEGGYVEEGGTVQGDYVIDQVDLNGWPQQITLHGAAVDAKAAAKERRTEAHQPPVTPTLGALVAALAGRNGWTPRVSAPLAAVPLEYEAQAAESDLAFLGRVVARHGGLVTVKQGHLVVAPRSGGRTVSGDGLPVLVVAPGVNLLDYRVSWKDRETHGSVQARSFDRATARPVTVTVGGGRGAASVIREPFQSEAEARAAATARATSLARGEGSASFSLEGDPAMGAERPVEVVGVRAGVDGRWTPTRVEHRWDDAGYATRIDCETPGQGDSRAAGAGAGETEESGP
ncbi:phage late control D family protein [Roseospira visakhapatnamensis]|uniref:Phage protein D n=1 Tax=Roseospira visakhapatnamensis TaxID=390880 RepID=A0A7W6WAN3_9PROT|nr:contractile injection system protein, VgrG/Pvc8 family [Roseospira visakhapatnamensis]MBB4267365.1 hypothetical protein [Roseospira visakhapatnamensis]